MISDEFPYIFSKEREELILTEMEQNKEDMMATQGIRPLSKAKQQKFTFEFRQWLLGKGAIGVGVTPDYSVKSISGSLTVHLPSSQMYGYEVFCRFSEVNDTTNKLGANPCSGKWNHHIYDVGMSVDDAIAQMVSWIEPVLLKN